MKKCVCWSKCAQTRMFTCENNWHPKDVVGFLNTLAEATLAELLLAMFKYCLEFFGCLNFLQNKENEKMRLLVKMCTDTNVYM